MPLMHNLKSRLVQPFMQKLKYDKMMPKVVSGEGAASSAGECAQKLKMTKVLIVTDEILMKLGVVDPCIQSLKDAGIEVVVYDQVQPDPKDIQVLAGAKLFKENNCDGIVAVGGGSSIDCAKIISVNVVDSRPIHEWEGAMKIMGIKTLSPIKLIAVPTTHGTGSEVTFAAVITNTSTGRKSLISDFKIIPRIAILDPQLLAGLPPSIAAATMMDALTHSIEAYISPWANDFARDRARSSVKNIFEYGTRVFHNGKDMEARAAILQASFDAGVAISIGAVGYVHAISHTLGALYHTPHGAANAMVLPYVLDFYGSAGYDRLSELAIECGLGSAKDNKGTLTKNFIQRIREMQKEMNMEQSVKGMTKKDIPQIVSLALEEAHGEKHSMIFNFGAFMKDAGYPCIKTMTPADCEKILHKLLQNPTSKL